MSEDQKLSKLCSVEREQYFYFLETEQNELGNEQSRPPAFHAGAWPPASGEEEEGRVYGCLGSSGTLGSLGLLCSGLFRVCRVFRVFQVLCSLGSSGRGGGDSPQEKKRVDF